MKKIILFAAILFAGVSVVNAQGNSDFGHSQGNSGNSGNNGNGGAVNSSGQTKLTVTLNPIQTITVNDDLVDLLYSTEADYKNGVTSVKDNHLKIYSTGGFSVTVNSKEDVLTAVGESENSIPSSTITVEAPSASAEEGFTSKGAVALSKGGVELFSTTKGGIDLKYKVNYVGAGTQKYFDKLFNGTSASVYETTVTYTIVAN